jgi:hypothetical protein
MGIGRGKSLGCRWRRIGWREGWKGSDDHGGSCRDGAGGYRGDRRRGCWARFQIHGHQARAITGQGGQGENDQYNAQTSAVPIFGQHVRVDDNIEPQSVQGRDLTWSMGEIPRLNPANRGKTRA